MRDEPDRVTTFCPRCGKPIVWSARPVEGGEALEVAAWSCSCPLTDDEWVDLAAEAGEALDERAGEGTRVGVTTMPSHIPSPMGQHGGTVHARPRHRGTHTGSIDGRCVHRLTVEIHW